MRTFLKNNLFPICAGLGVMVVAGAAFAAFEAPAFANDGKSAIMTKVSAALPNTKITSVNCDKPVKGLCEVIAGKNIFYTTKDARFIVIGSVLDLKTKKDVTDDRLKELAAVDNALAKIAGNVVQQAAGDVPVQPVANPQPGAGELPSAGVIKIDLPKANAIVHNAGAPIKISVFSDFNCHFCRSLYEAMAGAQDIEITEYPIGILGADSEQKAKLVLCSTDRVAAAQAAFNGGKLSVAADCAKADVAVRENGLFAKAHGITGTPTIIRADGNSQMGFKSLDELRNWAKGA